MVERREILRIALRAWCDCGTAMASAMLRAYVEWLRLPLDEYDMADLASSVSAALYASITSFTIPQRHRSNHL